MTKNFKNTLYKNCF